MRRWGGTLVAVVVVAGAVWIIHRSGQRPEKDDGSAVIAPLPEPSARVESRRGERIDAASGPAAASRIAPSPPPAESLAPLVVAGIVVDDDGRGVANAGLRIERLAPGDHTTQGHDTWGDVQGLWPLPRADDEGRFEVRGVANKGDYRISVGKSGYWSDNPLRFENGAAGVVLRLHRAGEIKGSIVLPSWIASSDVAITARLDVSDHSEWRSFGASAWTSLGDDGSFLIDRLRAGQFTVTIEIRSDRTLLREVSDVSVSAGETKLDPRLQKLDLSGLARPILLTVVDRDGERVPVAWAAEVPYPSKRPSGNRGVIRSQDDGEIRILLHSIPADIMVGAHGWRRLLVRGVSADREVVLDKGIPIRAVVAGDAPIPPKEIHTEAVLTFGQITDTRPGRQPDELVGRLVGETIDPVKRVAALRVAEAGRYQLAVWVNNRHGAQEVASTWIVVEDSDVPQSFEIAPSADAFEKALEKLRPR